MDKAKEAISKLTHNHGHNTTDVTEHYNPAVTHEHVSRTRENQEQTVIDKEQHHEHHHTTVLPVNDREVLPTEHKHVMAPATHTEHRHGDHNAVHDKVAAEAAQFKDRREIGEVEHTHTTAAAIGSEHHHHHVHETIQPVVQKQTIQPEVVHTTVPIHEVHHNEPKHYTASALPAVSMDEFKKQGGSLTGLADRAERFEGEPENIAHRGTHSELGSTGTTGTGISSTETGTGVGKTGMGSYNDMGTGPGVLGSGVSETHGTTTSESSTGKPSLLQKLNPFKDADGDGKKGVMS